MKFNTSIHNGFFMTCLPSLVISVQISVSDLILFRDLFLLFAGRLKAGFCFLDDKSSIVTNSSLFCSGSPVSLASPSRSKTKKKIDLVIFGSNQSIYLTSFTLFLNFMLVDSMLCDCGLISQAPNLTRCHALNRS